MRRRRKQYRKSFLQYAIPLVLSLTIAAGATMGVNSLVTSSLAGKQAGNLLLTFDVQEAGIFLIQHDKRTELPVGYKAEVRDGEGIETTTPTLLQLTFPDGMIMRMGEQTRVYLQKRSDLYLDIAKGNVWLRSEVERPVYLRGDFLTVRTYKGEWTVMDEGKVETLAVLEGSSDVTVQDGKEVVHELPVSAGNMMMMTKGIVQNLRTNPNLTLTSAIGADILAGSWFAKNMAESKTTLPTEQVPTQDIALVDQLIVTQDLEEDNQQNDVVQQNAASDTPSEDVEVPSEGACALTYPAQGKITKSKDVLKGTAPTGTARVEVNGYVLKRFVPGDSTWTYYLDAAKGGNMVLGTNTYTVTCVDKEGGILGEEQVAVAYLPN